MERGPMALFGAIVAVGLGPALWLGAQFGNLGVTPYSPPAVVSEQSADKAPGGAGAAPPEEPLVEPTKPATYKYIPLSGTPSARPSPSETAEVDEPKPEPSPSAGSDESDESAGPAESEEPTTPPTESATTEAPPPAEDEVPSPVAD